MGDPARSRRHYLSLLCIPLLLAGLLLPPAATAEPSSPAAQPLQDLLRSDGTLDLPAGYRGSLDARAFGDRAFGDRALGDRASGSHGSGGQGWQLVSGLGEAPRFAPIAESLVRTPGRSPTARSPLAPDDHWDGRFSPPGTNGAVAALAVDGNGNVYVGGTFTYAGGVPANRVARWDGSAWSSLGSGMDYDVDALAVDGNGNVYAGGGFHTAGGVAANHVARWDGSSWSPLGSGMNNEVYALAVADTGHVYAGGYFTTAGGAPANNIARWDGLFWASLGAGVGGTVYALAMDGSGNLYAGGYFTTAGGVPASCIARWDGSTWSPLGSGIDDIVMTLAIDNNGILYAGGYFWEAGGVVARYIARWDGSAWSALGSGMNSKVYALAVDGSGNVYAGGEFDRVGGVPINRIARWDGSAWSSVGSGMDSTVYALAVDGDGNAYAGGIFTTAGGIVANRIARWDGAAWSGLGSGMDNIVWALAMDGGGNTYAGGIFGTAGGVPAGCIARWDGSQWSSLGSEMNGNVYALAADDTGHVYAGGGFTTAGGIPANYVARWDGAAWSGLGSGMNGNVYALAVDGSETLYAGGSFTTAGGTLANYVALWDGSQWSALGSGMDGQVRALAVDGDGTLYAGGDFTTAGGAPANHIARWDGSQWSALGSGVNETVRALAVDGGGTLYAGGSFTTAGGFPADYVARWDGSQWSGLDSGMNGAVYALALDGSGALEAGGDFTTAGGSGAGHIARWDGSAWVALGSGTNGPVYALALNGSENAYVGGPFNLVGNKPSYYIARWFNPAPVANPDGYTTFEDTALDVPAPGLLANDGDIHGDPLTMILDTPPPLGTLALNADGSFHYTPTLNYFGLVTFTYRLADPYGGASTGAVSITVISVEDAPRAESDAYTTTEDTVLVVPAPGVLGNDDDGDGDALSAALLVPPLNGTAVLYPDGALTYLPAPDWYGQDTMTYLVTDGKLIDTATVSIAVTGVNDAPVAQDDLYTTAEDTPLAVPAPGVLDNDDDVEGDPLTAALYTPPAHGTVELSTDGALTYTPTIGFAGADSFSYMVSDGALTDTALVVIDVGEVNDPPVVQDDAYTTAEDVPLVVGAPGVLENDLDPEGAPLTALPVSPSAHGTLVLSADGSFTYTPELNWNGSDSFTYAASDGVLTATATVQLTVEEVNDAPVAANDLYSTPQDTVLTVPAPGVLGNDGDVEGDPLAAALYTPPAHGTVDLSADGALAYTPTAGFAGADSFIYTVSDGALTDTALVVIDVGEVDDPPVVQDDAYATDEDVPLAVAAPGVLENDLDPEGAPLTALLVSPPAHGALTLGADGSFTYTPEPNWNGVVSFTYLASDGGLTATAVARLTVTPVDDAPVALGDAYTMTTGTMLVVAAPGVLGNDGDVEGDPLLAVLDTPPVEGVLGLNADGSFVYAPPASLSGVVTFTYHTYDGATSSAPAVVTITVREEGTTWQVFLPVVWRQGGR